MAFEELQDRKERLDTRGRTSELDRLVASFDRSVEAPQREGLFNALAMLIVDATLDGDEPALEFAFDQFQHLHAARMRDHAGSEGAIEERGRLLALIDVAKWGLERTMPLDLLVEFEVSSHAHQILRIISDQPGATNTALMEELDIDPSQVSRISSRLEQAGMTRKRRAGRYNLWEITPRGVQALGILDAGGIARPKREHRQLQT
jgi:DNA-binding MarR family transcriptional regulator